MHLIVRLLVHVRGDQMPWKGLLKKTPKTGYLFCRILFLKLLLFLCVFLFPLI